MAAITNSLKPGGIKQQSRVRGWLRWVGDSRQGCRGRSPEEVTLQQRPGAGERVNPVDISGQSSPGRERAGKDLEMLGTFGFQQGS